MSFVFWFSQNGMVASLYGYSSYKKFYQKTNAYRETAIYEDMERETDIYP